MIKFAIPFLLIGSISNAQNCQAVATIGIENLMSLNANRSVQITATAGEDVWFSSDGDAKMRVSPTAPIFHIDDY